MPSESLFNSNKITGYLADIASAPNWASTVRAEVDDNIRLSWDPKLARTSRIMVPIDVQAFVVPDRGGELTVPLTGGPSDPEPFSTGVEKPAGVHLHWAMPDAMLRSADADPDADAFEVAPLPDRWVVLRILYPVGGTRPFVRGWVVDAAEGTVTALDGYSGDTMAGEQAFDRVDGLVGGGPLWTASYEASASRFGLHDPLDDLAQLRSIATDGLASEAATYVVAGWTTRRDDDPLESRSPDELTDILEDLDWVVDFEADLSHLIVPVSSEQKLMDTAEFSTPKGSPSVEIITPDRREIYEHQDVLSRGGLPVSDVDRVKIAVRTKQYASLFHGMVAGVPVDGQTNLADDRPAPGSLEVAVALDTDDAVSAFWSASLGASDDERQAIEQLAAAFVGGTLHKLGTDDGLRDIAEREHADGFFALPGKPLAGAQQDTLRNTDSMSVSPLNLGRHGRGDHGAVFGDADQTLAAAELLGDVRLGVLQNLDIDTGDRSIATATANSLGAAGVGRSALLGQPSSAEAVASFREVEFVSPNSPILGSAPTLADHGMKIAHEVAESRTVERPAPRMFRPAPPIIALRGARPSLRHHGDGQYDDQNRLRCRFVSELSTSVEGVADAAVVLTTLGSGAIPGEVLKVAQEAIVLTPWASSWLVAAANPEADDVVLELANVRMNGEMLRLYSADGRYDGSGQATLSSAPHSVRARRPRALAMDSWDERSPEQAMVSRQSVAEMARLSALAGSPLSPVAVTAWRQPWVPLWLEWRVEVTGSDSLQGWGLGALDFESTGTPSTAGSSYNFAGRAPVGRGFTHALHSSLTEWLTAENERDADLDDDQLEDLKQLERYLAPLDVASASLDGLREQLLGIDFGGAVASVDEHDDRPVASRAPMPLFGGTVRIVELRLVDAFGRTLDVPVSDIRTPSSLEVKGASASLAMKPRLQNGSRWLLRLVDPTWTGDPASAPEAYVDQIRPNLAVNPVAGFLLPDHIDEALEAFDVHGKPIGQLSHHEITGSVRWEPAPGRPCAPGAGPLEGLASDHPSAVPIGNIAAAMVRADVVQRNKESNPDSDPATAEGLDESADGDIDEADLNDTVGESPLSAMLRAIDTTLWSVDTYSALGSPSVAGLIGRPIAVVRANLTLDAPSDLGEVKITAPGGEAERQAAFDALTNTRFPVKLGDLQRSDDALLGYFVDDNYDSFQVIDRTVRTEALDAGRLRGQLGLLGTVLVPEVAEIRNSWVCDDDVIWVTPGKPVKLTMLMLPGGRVHLTSGILPRKHLALQNEWISALPKIMPSVRVGPVLVDPAEIRLPKVNLLGDKQQFTRRTGPLTWRDDPIVAASQTALLPRTPHEIQEGWIRIITEETS